MNWKNILFISIIIILLMGTCFIAVVAINNENNKQYFEANHPDYSYKLGIVGDMVIDIKYVQTARIVDLYYYNEKDEFNEKRVLYIFKSRSEAKKVYDKMKKEMIVKEGNKKADNLCLYKSSVIFYPNNEELKASEQIELTKEKLVEKIRNDYMVNEQNYTEIT